MVYNLQISGFLTIMSTGLMCTHSPFRHTTAQEAVSPLICQMRAYFYYQLTALGKD